MESFGLFTRDFAIAPASGAINLRLPLAPLLPPPPEAPSPAEKIAELEHEGRRLFSVLFDNIQTSTAERFAQQSRLYDIEAQLEELKMQLAEETSRRVALEERVKALGEEKAVVKAERNWFAGALQATEEKVVNIEAENDQLVTSIATITVERDILHTTLVNTREEADNTIHELSSARDDLASSLQEVKVKAEEVALERELLFSTLDEERKSNAESIAAVTAEWAEIAVCLSETKTKIEEVTTEREELRSILKEEREANAQSIAIVAAECTELTAHLSEAQSLNTQHERDISSLNANLAAETKKTRELQHAQVSSRRQIVHLSEKFSRLSSAIIVLQREKATLESVAGKKAANSEILLGTLRSFQREIATLRGRLDETEADARAKSAALVNMEKQHALEVASLNKTVFEAETQRDAEHYGLIELERRFARSEAQLKLQGRRISDAERLLQAEEARTAALEQRLLNAHEAIEIETKLKLKAEQELLSERLYASHHRAETVNDAPLSQEGKIERLKKAAAGVEKLVAARVEKERQAREKAEGENEVLKAQLNTEREAHRRTQEDVKAIKSHLGIVGSEQQQSAHLLAQTKPEDVDEVSRLTETVDQLHDDLLADREDRWWPLDDDTLDRLEEKYPGVVHTIPGRRGRFLDFSSVFEAELFPECAARARRPARAEKENVSPLSSAATKSKTVKRDNASVLGKGRRVNGSV